jgi:DNA-binding transcriptional LysR family regulator
VRQNLGVALLPCYIADRDETLRRILPDPIIDKRFDLWILYHADIRRVYRLRLVADFITTLVKSDQELFEGKRPL